MYNLELTESQAEFLIEMLADHAEYADPLNSDDRKMIAILDALEYQMTTLFDDVIARKIQERDAMMKKMQEERKLNESN